MSDVCRRLQIGKKCLLPSCQLNIFKQCFAMRNATNLYKSLQASPWFKQPAITALLLFHVSLPPLACRRRPGSAFLAVWFSLCCFPRLFFNKLLFFLFLLSAASCLLFLSVFLPFISTPMRCGQIMEIKSCVWKEANSDTDTINNRLQPEPIIEINTSSLLSSDLKM